MNKYFIRLVFLLTFVSTYSQEVFDEKLIIENNTNYFKLERENIHTQFNKTVYTTGETIWLKGYVIDKITGLPNIKSANIIMELLNSKGERIDSKLLYSENSTFHGYYNTELITESGNYYFRFFSNYMNNFSEDESVTYEIAIINPSNYNIDLHPKFNPNKISINYYPESGVLLENTDNTIVAEIKDCNGIGNTIQDIDVLNDKNEIVTTFSTNEQGYGKFKLLETKNSNYKIKLKQNNALEKVIEKPKAYGYIISINDNFNSETLFVDLKTNKTTLSNGKTIWLGIQHLDNLNLVKVDFDTNTLTKKLAFSKKDLNQGIINFILFNEKKEIMAERLYFNHNTNVSDNIVITNKTVTNDSIKYKFKSNFNLGELSYSIMPSKTLTKPNRYNTYSSLLLNNHLTTEIDNSHYYFNNYNRLKHFELDVALYTKKYKYNFLHNINIPTEKFKFENGLSIIGRVNSEIINKDYKINLTCLSSGVNLITTINEKNEFKFDNLIVRDSTAIFLTLVNKKDVVKNFTTAFNLVKAKNQLYKPFKAKQSCLEESTDKEIIKNLKFPKPDRNAHWLDSVQIEKTIKKQKLTNRNNSAYANSFADGYKITDEIAKNYMDLISFLRSKGYEIRTYDLQSQLYYRMGMNKSEVVVMIDNAPLMDVNFLNNYRMSDIDEIYINKRGYGAGSAGANGIISIFTKKTYTGKKHANITAKSYICKDGFTPSLPFKNNLNINFNDESFLNFGNIFWNVKTVTNQNGEFEISLPRINNGSIILVLDGINSTGQVISKTIDIQP
ncbi:MAG: hypothetical protein KBC56_06400 [Flavobacterium sp.]|nr:hypothetical protein [Flavobacterium sp.]